MIGVEKKTKPMIQCLADICHLAKGNTLHYCPEFFPSKAANLLINKTYYVMASLQKVTAKKRYNKKEKTHYHLDYVKMSVLFL